MKYVFQVKYFCQPKLYRMNIFWPKKIRNVKIIKTLFQEMYIQNAVQKSKDVLISSHKIENFTSSVISTRLQGNLIQCCYDTAKSPPTIFSFGFLVLTQTIAYCLLFNIGAIILRPVKYNSSTKFPKSSLVKLLVYLDLWIRSTDPAFFIFNNSQCSNDLNPECLINGFI